MNAQVYDEGRVAAGPQSTAGEKPPSQKAKRPAKAGTAAWLLTALIVLSAFQFAPGSRRRRPGWHRVAGRLLVPCGLLVGLSALWMTLFYPWPDGDGALLAALRLLFGSAMVASIVLGFAAIRRRDVMG